MTVRLVGCVGPAGSGKSLLADHLINHHRFTQVSLAAPLKRVVGQLFGFTTEQLYGPSSAREQPHPTLTRPDGSPLTARYALQTLGTDWGRAVCTDVWVHAAMQEVDRVAGSTGLGVVLPDVRFINEMEAIRARGGKLIRRTMPVTSTDPHPSEAEQLSLPDSYFDVVLPRAFNRDKLYAQIDALMGEWRL